MKLFRLRMWLLPVCAAAGAVLSGCSSTGHTPVSDYPLVPPTDLVVDGAMQTSGVGLDAPDEGQSLLAWTATWLDGPVSALATEPEFEAYQQLDETRARVEFIRGFWERRTPPPNSVSQLAVDTARQRTVLAEELFGDQGMPGWRTPFGRVLSILGLPELIEEGTLRSGPRTSATERLWARNGDQVLWQYGLDPTAAASRESDVFTAPHFVAFTFGTDGWSLRCGDGWLAATQFAGPDPRADVVESPASPDTRDRALANPFMTRGTKASSGYADGKPPQHVRRFGGACLELFERVRSAWLVSATPTDVPG